MAELRQRLKKSATSFDVSSVNANSSDCPLRPAGADGGPLVEASLRSLDAAGSASVRVVSVEGGDALSERLAAAGLWPGVVVERLASAPFGGPLLFRVQGYRLALLRSEASRVRVASTSGAAG